MLKYSEEFDSPEEKILRAKDCLKSLSCLAWCEIGSGAIDKMKISEDQANALIKTFNLTIDALLLREKEIKRQEYERRRNNAKQGFVYLMHLFKDYYKIGKSANPESRLKTIVEISQRLSGIDLFKGINPVLISTIPSVDMGWAEEEMHQKYDAVRDRTFAKHCFDSYELTTEIFKLSPEDVQDFKETKELVPEWFSAEWMQEV